MIDKVFFDTNLIIYLFDLKDLKKRDRIKRLLHNLIGKSHLIISVQVINEFINFSTKKIGNAITSAELIDKLEFINELFIISSLSFQTSTSALTIKNRYGFSFGDSLIIASALENNCNILYSEDLQHNQIINSKLTVINPFL